MATKKTTSKAAEPSTMEELLALTGYKPKGFKRGETVTGKVTQVGNRMVLVDIGGKTEAAVSDKEWELSREYLRAIKVGDEVTGIVMVPESDAGQVILSLRRAAADSKWKKFEEALDDGSTIMVRGKEVTKGGLLVEAEGVFGFVPSSQLSHEAEENVGSFVGKTFSVKVIEVDRLQNRLVLSERAVSEAEEIEQRKKALSGVKMGEEYKGIVVGMVPFGAFVEIDLKKGDKLEGLVHISEMSWEKVDDVGKLIKEGDKVSVQVIGIDEESGKLALSIKRLSGDPWAIVAKKYLMESKHEGVVTKIAPYGILVRMERGIEGLIHASKMPVDMSFKEGDKVEVFVESVDLEKRRLSLGVVLSAKPVGYK